MSTWRVGRSWPDEALAAALDRAAHLSPSVGGPDDALTLEHGWSQVRSQALVAREEPGEPRPGGAFQRACALVMAMEHSDPRVVLAHFDAGRPFEGRDLLLELKALGMHFLAPVRVAEVRRASDVDHTLFGFQIVTLPGHIERGREWFLLEKRHATGEVRFRIEAAWQPGEFPGWWARLGFHLLGRRYQRAWHRLTHERLRKLLASGGVEVPSHGLVHEGAEVPTEPVQFAAQRGHDPRGVTVEQEHELMPRDRHLRAFALGTLAGVRSMSAPAVVAGVFGGPGPRRFAAAAAAVLAAELVADKLPGIPSRTHPISLLGRTLSGALGGAAMGQPGRRIGPALIGAASAASATFAVVKLRRLAGSSKLGSTSAGLLEDALVLTAARKLARARRLVRPLPGNEAPGVRIEDAIRTPRAGGNGQALPLGRV